VSQAHGLGGDSVQDFWRTGNAKQDGYRGFMGQILRRADCKGWLPCRYAFVSRLRSYSASAACKPAAAFADQMPCAVEANAGHFYLSSRLPGHNVPTGEGNFWYDISTGVANASDNPNLLGGSMSFWTDEFS